MQKKSEKDSNNSRDSVMPRHSFRRESLRLIREATDQLGWKYRLWIPASAILALVFLLPPRLLLFFTENVTSLAGIDALDFLKRLIIFGIAIAVCLWIGIFLGGVLAEWLRIQISVALRKDAMASLLDAGLENVDTAQRGDWMTRMTGDLRSCEDFLSDSLPEQIRNLTILLGSAILFALHSGWIALIPVVAAIFLAWLNVVAQKKMAPVLGEAREIEGNIFQTIIEAFEGLRTIRSYIGEESVKQNLARQLDTLKRVGMRIIKIMAGLMGLNEMASQIVITGILTLVAYQFSGDSLTASDALVYPFYINLFLGSAKALVAAAYDWNRFFIEGGRLASLIYNERKEIDSEQNLKGAIGAASIIARQIDIRYGDEPPVVLGFDFQVSRGELVVLMGPSGSGKSTILEVLSGLRSPSGGKLSLSTAEGKEEEAPMIPRSLCAFVEQQPYLFVGSIRDNILLGRADATDSEIMDTIAAVGLTSVIEEREGLDAILADRGRNLSVGQQYRLAFCRALISQRPFLMLDEPFAALDDESSATVIRSIESAKGENAGIVLVTHLVPDELKADQVIELG